MCVPKESSFPIPLKYSLICKAVMNMGWCSNCFCESGPAEPPSMHSRSRRRRDRDRRHAILQAQAKSFGLKKLLWYRPRDVVAGATGQGDVGEIIHSLAVAPETMHTGCGDPETE